MSVRYSRPDKVTVLISFLLTLFVSCSVWAQAPLVLEELIVTARKRVETLQDVPVTMSAFSQQELENSGVISVTDLDNLVPNMQINSGGPGSSSTLRLRGIGTSSISAAFDPAVALNIDGVVLAASRMIVSGQMDMRQIEVLKGPQSLYFGKSATAGVVSILTNDPGQDFEFMLRHDYATQHDGNRIEAVVSSPLTDDIAARFAFASGEIDEARKNLAPGVANEYRGEERSDMRLTLVWDVSSDLTAKLKSTFSDYDDDGPNSIYNVVCPDGAPQTSIVSGVVFPGGFDDCKLNEKIGIADAPAALLPAPGYSTFADWNNGVPYTKQESQLTSLQLNWYVFESYELTSVSSIFDMETDFMDSFDYSLGAGASHAFNGYESISQEFRLESDFDGDLNFSTGFYYADIEQELTTGQNAFNFGLLGIPDPTGNGHDWDKSQFLDTTTWSAFAALYWNITDDLELTIGARYTEDDKEGRIEIPYMRAALSAPPAFGGLGFVPSGSAFEGDGLELKMRAGIRKRRLIGLSPLI